MFLCFYFIFACTCHCAFDYYIVRLDPFTSVTLCVHFHFRISVSLVWKHLNKSCSDCTINRFTASEPADSVNTAILRRVTYVWAARPSPVIYKRSYWQLCKILVFRTWSNWAVPLHSTLGALWCRRPLPLSVNANPYRRYSCAGLRHVHPGHMANASSFLQNGLKVGQNKWRARTHLAHRHPPR